MVEGPGPTDKGHCVDVGFVLVKSMWQMVMYLDCFLFLTVHKSCTV